MKGDTLAIRDRLLAVLRAADRPLTTQEVCDLAGPFYETREGCHPWQHRDVAPGGYVNPWVRLVSCDGERHVLALNLVCGQRGYLQLRALEKQGIVGSLRTPGHRVVSWVYAGGRVDAEVDELERMWSAS